MIEMRTAQHFPLLVNFPANLNGGGLHLFDRFQTDTKIGEVMDSIRDKFKGLVSASSPLLLHCNARVLHSHDTLCEAKVGVHDVIAVVLKQDGGMPGTSPSSPVVQPPPSSPVVQPPYDSFYIDDMISSLGSLGDNAESKLHLASLKHLKLVLENRLKPHGNDIRFDARVDDDEVLLRFFSELDTNRNGKIEMAELQSSPLLRKKENFEMAKVLEDELGTREIDLLALKTAVRKVPRVAGQRTAWVRGIGLDAALARHLPPGTLDDELRGIKETLDDNMIDRAFQAFSIDAARMVKDAVRRLKFSQVSSNAVQANSKFEGFFEGSFANLDDYHRGAEETMNLDYPNPRIEEGILTECTKHPSSRRLFITPNYQIVTCLLIEYWWAKDPSVDDVDLKDMLAHLGRTQSMYPGEVGDSYFESLVSLEITTNSRSAAARSLASDKTVDNELGARLKKELPEDYEILQTEVETVMGIKILNHAEFIQWKAQSLLEKIDDVQMQVQEEQDYGTIFIGIILPMSESDARLRLPTLDRKIENISRSFCAAKDLSLLSNRSTVVSCRQSRYVESIDLKAFRKHHVATSPAAEEEREICEMRLKEELQRDFIEALQSISDPADLNKALRNIYKLWGMDYVPSHTATAALIEAAATKLTEIEMEERWDRLAQWVALFRRRIQGRKRLGLKKLKDQQKEKIKQFGLQDGEVLALHLYTGPCFVPFNSIYRKFPPHMVKLLEGSKGFSANTMSTTLFCISSALVTLGRHTELPEDRKVYRGLGAMLLPRQFWVEHGTPAWKGGVEKAIMSTTSDKEIALFYSGGKGMVVEIGVGRIQIGGDVSWCSMVGQ